MKRLPCDTPSCQQSGGAVGPNGAPRLSAQYTREVRCRARGCQKVTFISAARWASLPELTVDELRAYGIEPTTDLVGALDVDTSTRTKQDRAREMAEDLLRAGFIGADDLEPFMRKAGDGEPAR